MHDKKEKGDLAVSAVIYKLTELGWHIGLPLSEHMKYDLFAEKNGKIHLVQVRYGRCDKKIICADLRSAYSDSKGIHIKKREKGDYTLLAIYNPCCGVFFITDKEIGDVYNTITFRLEKPKNNQVKNIRFGEDYRNI